MYVESLEIVPDYLEKVENYVANINAIKNLKKLNFEQPISFFVGENGTGKSTLLEALAISLGFNPEGGSKNFIFSTYNSHSSLYKGIKIVKSASRPRDGYFLRAETLYNIATSIEEMDAIECEAPPVKLAYGGQSLHSISHGEGMLTIILRRFKGNGLYILDEPEIALSPLKQLSILTKIHDLAVHKNSQFIIITHSPILITCPNSEVFLFDENEIKKVNYCETEHFQLTKQFINSPKSILSKML
jgi:predicted ATPase